MSLSAKELAMDYVRECLSRFQSHQLENRNNFFKLGTQPDAEQKRTKPTNERWSLINKTNYARVYLWSIYSEHNSVGKCHCKSPQISQRVLDILQHSK